jgi:acyl carrier protein
MPDAAAYMDIVATSIAAELAISKDQVVGDTRLGDLGLDSLDVLKVTFRIEQQLQRRLPVQEWLSELGESSTSLEELRVADLCNQLMTLA